MAKWTKYKGRKGKGILKRWSADNIKVASNTDTPRARILADKGEGGTVLYREHAKSAGHVSSSGKISHFVPVSNVKYDVDRYAGVPDTQVPPVIAVIRSRTRLWQAKTNGTRFQGYDKYNHFVVQDDPYLRIVCCFQGTRAFFVEHDQIMLTLRESVEYRMDTARVISQQGRLNRIQWMTLTRVPPPVQDHPP